ncbi:hypothetical protein D3C72_1438590 [compost metagenome]
MDVRCDPVTLPCMPRRWLWKARVSMWRDSGSSDSSQCMSTISPRSQANSHSRRTDSAPSAMVRSKCGMPPTTSTPMAIARFRLSKAPGLRRMPSCGNATSCKSRYGATCRLTSSSASTASRRGSQISTCERMASKPRATAQSQYCRARSTNACCVNCGFSSPHRAMPSSRVPEAFTRGKP